MHPTDSDVSSCVPLPGSVAPWNTPLHPPPPPPPPPPDNDKADFRNIAVAPTEGEVLCDEDPYLPPNRWGLVWLGWGWERGWGPDCNLTKFDRQGNNTNPTPSPHQPQLPTPPTAPCTPNRPGTVVHVPAGDPHRAHRELHFRLLRHDLVGEIATAVQALRRAGGVGSLPKQVGRSASVSRWGWRLVLTRCVGPLAIRVSYSLQ